MPDVDVSEAPGVRRMPATNLRERRRTRTKLLIQSEALGLFATKGYEETTIEDVAHAAAISPRTFYRYFACKEDVVLWDELDEIPVGDLWDVRPGQDVVAALSRRIRELVLQLYRDDPERLLARIRLSYTIPEIRARFVNRQLTMVTPYAAELRRVLAPDADEFAVTVRATAVLAAVFVAMETWQHHDGNKDLPDLVDRALAAVGVGQGRALVQAR